MKVNTSRNPYVVPDVKGNDTLEIPCILIGGINVAGNVRLRSLLGGQTRIEESRLKVGERMGGLEASSYAGAEGRLMVYKYSGLYTSAIWIEGGRLSKAVWLDLVRSFSKLFRDAILNAIIPFARRRSSRSVIAKLVVAAPISNYISKKKKDSNTVEMAITTAASLDAAHDSDNIIRTQTTVMPNVDIPRGMDTGHTSGSGEGSMEYQFELTANVPSTPHDLPLPGGYTPRSDEGRLKLQELMTRKRVNGLERQRKSSTSQPRRRKYRPVESSDDDLNKEDASKQRRSNDKTKQ
ncbi:hypothetical protein Tco_0217530 [Tanacetum coccineum]